MSLGPRSERGRVYEIDHISVLVTDADRAAQYYKAQFGLESGPDEIVQAANVRLLHLDCGNVWLQLAQPVGPGPLRNELAAAGTGLHHVCFRVPSIEKFVEMLPGEVSNDSFVGGGGRRAYFLKRPPAGMRIELIEASEME